MTLDEFANLLKQTMGLDASSIGISTIERALQTRMSERRVSDLATYWQQLNASNQELQALIEAVVVPETWFFRDRDALTAAAQTIRDDERPTTRLLSLPCSTGEEPYSIAMALLDAGISADRFSIDAVDISTHALTQAEAGIYGKNSFRGNDIEFRDRHFTPTPQGFRIDDAVRRQVRFQRGNILVPATLPGGPYDIVFCRNLLIYFESATQDRAISTLAQRLTDLGWLFVGPSEGGAMLRSEFSPIKISQTFVFRKGQSTTPMPVAPVAWTPPPPAAPKPVVKPMPVNTKPAVIAAPASPKATPINVNLDDAERLANQGRLEEAAALCEQYLQQQGPSAKAFHLLGLVHDAENKLPQADMYYRKALYLDPGHQPSLIHLACLLEKRGDGANARVLRDRAKRSETRNSEAT